MIVQSRSRPCRAEMFHHGGYNSRARADSDQLCSILQRHKQRPSEGLGEELKAYVRNWVVEILVLCVRVRFYDIFDQVVED